MIATAFLTNSLKAGAAQQSVMLMFETEIFDSKPHQLSALKPMMQAKLELTLVEKVRVLLHVAKLELGTRRNRVTYCAIQTIPIVVVDLAAIANVALSIDKQLVIERQIPRALRNYRRIQGDRDKQCITKAGSKILTIDPSLFKP